MSKLNDQSRQALVGDIGRTAIRLGLTDEVGLLRPETVRVYSSWSEPTVASVIKTFASESGLDSMPPRCALAISGVPRGELIPVTNSRLTLSRTELTSLFGAAPLLLNDFAANAWALSGEVHSDRVKPLVGSKVRPYRPGAYCIIGVGSGLGVALLSRDEFGVVSVIPTEGGHMGYMTGLPEAAAVMEMISRNGCVTAETLLSRRGLVAIYQGLVRIHGADITCVPDLLDVHSSVQDPIAEAARAFFAEALWYFAGNMALAYGAWDGVVLTGSVTAALRPVLKRAQHADRFMIPGPYQDKLRDVPRSQVSFEFAELEGASVALLNDELRRDQLPRRSAAGAAGSSGRPKRKRSASQNGIVIAGVH